MQKNSYENIKKKSKGVELFCRYKLKRRVYSVPEPKFRWHADNHDKDFIALWYILPRPKKRQVFQPAIF